jgi:2-methylcitrate dehydratase PrpD
MSDEPLIAQLARHLQRPVPEYVRTRARLHLLDWLACVAGAKGSMLGRREMLGEPLRMWQPPFLGNVLEMDDVHRSALLHPGPVIWPSAFMFRFVEKDLIVLLDAAMRGYEAMVAVGTTFDAYHYAHWHPTATIAS